MTILDLYQSLGLASKSKTSKEYCGPCPHCGGEDRFTLFLEQGEDGLGRFWCRQCSVSGDRIQFLREFKGLSYPEACGELNLDSAKSALDPPSTPKRPSEHPTRAWKPKNNQSPPAVWQSQTMRLIQWAASNLQSFPGIIQWLQEAWGLSFETIKKARLGWCPKTYYRHRSTWGLPPEIKKNGKPKRIRIPHGLVIPIPASTGHIARVKFRCAEGEPKYFPLPTVPTNTAPLILQSEAKPWVVVESELDALLLHQEAGSIVNVMALGSVSYPPDLEASKLLKAAPIILVCLDYDEAGQKRTYQWWKSHFSNSMAWPVPKGKIFVTHGWQAIRLMVGFMKDSLGTGRDMTILHPPPPKSLQSKT